jgi:hypothetical protein
MVGIPGSTAGRFEVSITQASVRRSGSMERSWRWTRRSLERIRQLIVRQSDNGDREADLTNLRLILAQFERIGQRIAYWNARVRRLVEGQLSPRAGSQGASHGGVDK